MRFVYESISGAGRLLKQPNCFSANPLVLLHHSRHLSIRANAAGRKENKEGETRELMEIKYKDNTAVDMQVIPRGNLQFRTSVPDIHIDLVGLDYETVIDSVILRFGRFFPVRQRRTGDGAVQEPVHPRTCMIRYCVHSQLCFGASG